jgi:hypothetical protein
VTQLYAAGLDERISDAVTPVADAITKVVFYSVNIGEASFRSSSSG